MSTCFSSFPKYVTEASVLTIGAIASGKFVFASRERQSSCVTTGRFLYFHQSLQLTPHFHLWTKSVLGPRVLSWRRKLVWKPDSTVRIPISIAMPSPMPEMVSVARSRCARSAYAACAIASRSSPKMRAALRRSPIAFVRA